MRKRKYTEYNRSNGTNPKDTQMIIKKLTISNYRSVKSDDASFELAVPNGTPGSGLTIVVGSNNVGKSNLFHALDLLFNKANPENIKNKQRTEDDSEIIAELMDDDFETSITEYVQANKQQAFKDLVFEEDGIKKFKIRRKSESSAGTIEIWDAGTSNFKNVAGIDAPIQKWLHFLPLWANTTTEEVADYSAKSIIGELLAKIIEEIQTDEDYVKLHTQFEKIFGIADTSTLSRKTSAISTEVSDLIKDQFEEIGIKFKADPPKIDQYVKQIKTLVDDGDETEISEKGSGLQRAIMIALIQVYSKSLSTGTSKKPFFLFIDEPELYLNPQAQKVLLTALRKISANEQVFLVTHSPYFIDWNDYSAGARIGKAKKVEGSTELFWMDNPSAYSGLLEDYVLSWQQPYLLDTVAKEILFCDKLLFLEGQEDVGLIRKWSQENAKDLKFDIFGYGAGGFDKYAAYLKLANDLGLDKVSALYDNGEAERKQMAIDATVNTSYKLFQLSVNDIRDKYTSCGSCDKCLEKKFKSCTTRTQKKDGCFDESGSAKAGTAEFIDFEAKLDEIIHYFES